MWHCAVLLPAAALASGAAHGPNICPLPDGTRAPCGPGNEQCTRPGFGRASAQFHIRDESCGLNDPNGPVYDAVHGIYHFFYQNHVAMPPGRGPVYGHVVSRDLAHWARMPVAIWNDRPYDNGDIFTGSATIVDGKIVQVYPGLCDPEQDGCPGPTNLCIAVPANESDPLLAEWVKDEFVVNPIVNNTGRDPTTAWKTSHGEWRLSTFDGMIFGSMDFKTWYPIGKQGNFTQGECPSLFPLPRTTPGAGPAPEGAETPSHVHKSSHNGADFMSVGTYTEGDIGTPGTWIATPGIAAGLGDSRIDAGKVYASKDFYDPVKKRRINWGWAFVNGGSTTENFPGKGVTTLPREVTWNPELQQLVHSPLEEQDLLRGEQLANLRGQDIAAHTTVSLGKWPESVGNQSEVEVIFERPSIPARVGVVVMASPAFRCTAQPLGCFVDGGNRILEYYFNNAKVYTLEECAVHCKQAGYDGGVGGIEDGGDCFCGHDLREGAVRAEASECNVACGGNSSEACGAAWRLSAFNTSCEPASSDTLPFGKLFYIDYDPDSAKAIAGAVDVTPPPPPETDPVGTTRNGNCGGTNWGGDCDVKPTGSWHIASENITDLASCVARAEKCKMADYVSFSEVNGDCAWYAASECDFHHLKIYSQWPYQSELLRVPAPTPPTPSLGTSQELQLAPGDSQLRIRVYVDNTFSEAYFMDGRAAITLDTNPSAEAQMVVTTTADVRLVSAIASRVGSIWVTPQEVLDTPRLDMAQYV